MRDLGDLGEKAFALLCSQAGFNAHPPDHDLFGWDYLVEAPTSFLDHPRLLDSLPPPLEFRVQVKATDDAISAVQISLAHLLRLSKIHMPVFFLLLQFNGSPEPAAAYLAHLGDDLMARTLRRARMLSASGRKDPSKHTLTIRFGDAHRLSDPLYDGFNHALKRYVPKGMDAYLASKKACLETIGFDSPRVIADVTFSGIDAADHFLDVLLGLRKEIVVDEMRMREFRFGIPEDIHRRAQGGARLSITAHEPLKAAIELRADPYSPPVEVCVDWYVAPSVFPAEKRKHRLEASTFDLFLWPDSDRMSFKQTVQPEIQLPLRELKDFIAVTNMLRQPCRFALKQDGIALFTTTVHGAPNLGGAQAEKVAAAAWDLAVRAGISDRVRTCLRDLYNERTAYMDIAALLGGAPVKAEFDDPRHHHPDRRVGVITTFWAPLGQFQVAGVCAVVGVTEPTADGFAVKTSAIRVIRTCSVPIADWDEGFLQELIAVASEELESEQIIPIAA